MVRIRKDEPTPAASIASRGQHSVPADARPELAAVPLHLFAGLRVRDFQAARPWYERLLGEPTFFPHATEAVWTLADVRSVYIVEHADRAGNSVVTIFLDDLDTHVAAIRCPRPRARRAPHVLQRRTQGSLPRRRRQRTGVRRRRWPPLHSVTGLLFPSLSRDAALSPNETGWWAPCARRVEARRHAGPGATDCRFEA